MAKVSIDVPFYDLDGLNVVWHGHYYKYFEQARTAFLRQVGFDAPQMKKSGYLWFVIESHCRYVAPMRYGMTVVVEASLADVEHRVKFLIIPSLIKPVAGVSATGAQAGCRRRAQRREACACDTHQCFCWHLK